MTSPSPSQCSETSSYSSFQSDDDQGMFFDDLYDMSVFLHKGQFGDTYRCIERETGDKYAVKLLAPSTGGSRQKSSNGRYDDVVSFSREGAIWRRLKHRNVVELFRIFNTPNEQYLITEYVKDGKLFDQIMLYTTYTERDICFFTKQLLEALVYLRNKRVIHRSITTESILVAQSEHGETLKLCDFGLSLRLERGQKFIKTEPKGIPLYLSPEIILEKPINYAVDAWSAGIIVYILFSGYPPFWNERLDVLYGDILTRPVDVSSANWDSVSKDAKELIDGLLDKDVNTRMTPENALNHAWINEHCNIPKDHRQKSVDKLKEFNARRKSRGDLFTVQRVFPGDKERLMATIKQKKKDATGHPAIIKSFGEMRRKKMFEEDKKYQENNQHNSRGGKMTVVSKTKTIDLSKNTNKSRVCVQFQPKKVYVDLNMNVQ